jgi:hypothetical protein
MLASASVGVAQSSTSISDQLFRQRFVILGNPEHHLLGFSSVITSATTRASIASQEENEWPREGHTNPFAQPERTGIVRVHQKSQDQSGAKVEPSRRTTAPDRRAQA